MMLLRAALVLGVVLTSSLAHARLSLAVFKLEVGAEVEPSLAALLTLGLVEQARETLVFQRVISPDEVTAMLGAPAQEQLAACARDACMLVDEELAGALGASHMLMGSVLRVAGQYVVSVRMLDLRNAQEVATARATREVIRPADLAEVVRPLVHRLVANSGVLKEAAPDAQRHMHAALTGEAERAPAPPWLTISGLVSTVVGAALLGAAVPPAVLGGTMLMLLLPSVLVAWRIPGVVPLVNASHSAYGAMLGGGPAASAAAAVVGTAAAGALIAGAACVWAGRLTEQ